MKAKSPPKVRPEIGKVWDDADKAGVAYMKELGKEVRTAEAELSSAITSKSLHIERDWLKKASAKGMDGEAMMAALRKAVQ